MRWIVQDPTSQTTYIFPANPNKMSSPLAPDAVTPRPAAPTWGIGDVNSTGPKTSTKNSDVVDWTFEGKIVDQATLTNLQNILALTGRVYLTDHLQRTFLVRFYNVNTDEQPASQQSSWRFQYVVHAYVYGLVG